MLSLGVKWPQRNLSSAGDSAKDSTCLMVADYMLQSSQQSPFFHLASASILRAKSPKIGEEEGKSKGVPRKKEGEKVVRNSK